MLVVVVEVVVVRVLVVVGNGFCVTSSFGTPACAMKELEGYSWAYNYKICAYFRNSMISIC